MAAVASQVAGCAPWKTLLQRSLAQNSSLPYAKYMQLATVRADGKPANRTVVFRGFLGDTDDLTFVTDQRSRKVTEVAINPHGEICWYFPHTREQYRISGPLQVVGAPAAAHHQQQQQAVQAEPQTSAQQQQQGQQQLEQQQQQQGRPDLQAARQAAWARMSAAGRAQFCWPTPRQPRMPAEESLFLLPEQPAGSSGEEEGEVGPPAAFCLVVMVVEEVDLVDLYANTRTIFTQQQQALGGSSSGSGAAASSIAAEVSWQQMGVNP